MLSFEPNALLERPIADLLRVLENKALTGGPPSRAAAESFNWPLTSRCNGVCHVRSQVTLAQVGDGTSNTYLVGEKYIDPDHYLTGRDGGDSGATRSGTARVSKSSSSVRR